MTLSLKNPPTKSHPFEIFSDWAVLKEDPNLISSPLLKKNESEKLNAKIKGCFQKITTELHEKPNSKYFYITIAYSEIKKITFSCDPHLLEKYPILNIQDNCSNTLLNKDQELANNDVSNSKEIHQLLIKNNLMRQEHTNTLNQSKIKRTSIIPIKSGRFTNLDYAYSTSFNSNSIKEYFKMKCLNVFIQNKLHRVPIFSYISGDLKEEEEEENNLIMRNNFFNLFISNMEEKLIKEFSQKEIKKINKEIIDCEINNSLKFSFENTSKSILSSFPNPKHKFDPNIILSLNFCLIFNKNIWTVSSGKCETLLSQSSHSKPHSNLSPVFLSREKQSLESSEQDPLLEIDKSPSFKSDVRTEIEKNNQRLLISKFPIIKNQNRTFLIMSSEAFWEQADSKKIAAYLSKLDNEQWNCQSIVNKMMKKISSINIKNLSLLIVELTYPDFFKNWIPTPSGLISPLLRRHQKNYLEKKIPEAIVQEETNVKDVHQKFTLSLPLGKITDQLIKKFPSLKKYFMRDKIFPWNRATCHNPKLIANKLEKQFHDSNTLENLNRVKHNKTLSFSKPLIATIGINKDPLELIPEQTSYIGEKILVYTKGNRKSMEDAHLANLLTVNINGQKKTIPLFGIFDGHSGKDCSNLLAKEIKSHLESKMNDAFHSKELNEVDLYNILKLSFVELGELFQKNKKKDSTLSGGSTATIALIIDDHLWVANVGDSRTILSLNSKVIALSEDARLDSEKFKKSVYKRGQAIINHHDVLRVHALNMSHSVGHDEVESGINPRAKIIKYPLKDLEKNNYLVLGCDGIFDVLSSESVHHTIQNTCKTKKLEKIALNLVKTAYKTSNDNISLMIVQLNPLITTS